MVDFFSIFFNLKDDPGQNLFSTYDPFESHYVYWRDAWSRRVTRCQRGATSAQSR
jgi:hypothetical protein